MIKKDYINLFYQEQICQTHYRSDGSGSPLILLHPSPLSSAFMTPLIELFSNEVQVLAPDTPGYGQSDPLPRPGDDLAPYVDWLRRVMDALGLQSAGVYGSATGAQIAIQFARAHPDRTDYLLLENAVHFENEEREWILKDYFPDMAPRPDGSHLALAWEMSSRLFERFPWFDEREEARISVNGPPVEVINATALSYLAAGKDYARAYRAAFNNEDAANMQRITVPTRVLRWQGSILKRYADRLDNFEWPDHIQMISCEATPEARFEALLAQVRELS